METNKYLKAVTSLSILFLLGGMPLTGHAHRISSHRYHKRSYRIKRYIKYHRQRRIKLRCHKFRRHRRNPKKRRPTHIKSAYFNPINTAHHIRKLSNMGSTDMNIFRRRLLHDINQCRINHGLRPLKVTDAMQKAANYRAPKVLYAYEDYNDYVWYPSSSGNPSDSWVHGSYNHTSAGDFLNAHGYSYKYIESNSCSFAKGYSRYSKYPDLAPYKFNNNTPQGMADNVFESDINHDNASGNNNSHRHTILDPKLKYIGVACQYNPSINIGADNEQFAY